MNDRQENKLGMFRSTGQLLTENAAVFAAVPAMVTQHQNLLDSTALIDSLAQAQTAVTTGVTVDKRTFQDQMVSYALRVAGAVKAYASTAGNATLRDKADITPSDFTHARDDQRDDIAQGVHDDANGVIRVSPTTASPRPPFPRCRPGSMLTVTPSPVRRWRKASAACRRTCSSRNSPEPT